jgi:hypothetical protein
MTKRPIYLIVAGLIWLGAMPLAHGHDREQEVRDFVQSFYDWYVPKFTLESIAAERALRERPEIFRRDLYRALDADFRAQANSGEINGIDWDPFTASQDPCDRYSAGRVAGGGNVYRVSVTGNCGRSSRHGADAIAVVEWEDGRWRFINFEYPDHSGNLIDTLRQLAESRK